MRNTERPLVRYLTTVGGALAASGGILWLRNFSSAATLAEKYRILSDAFSIPGILLMCFFGLIWVSSDGFFDGLGYTFSRIGGMFVPGMRAKHETYFDYKMRKRDKREERENGGFGFLFFVGLAFVLISVVFVILFETVYVPA